MAHGFTKTVPIDTDASLSNNSDFLVASQKAVKSYVDNNTFLGSNSQYIDQSGGDSDTYGALVGLVNGSNTVFTVSEGAYISGSLKVYLNGQLQTQGLTEDFAETTPSSGTFTFATAPIAGSLITVEYLKSLTVSGNSDTLDGYHASAFVQKTSGGVVEVDFGADGDVQQTYTLSNANIGTNSQIICTVRAKDTTNNSADDIASQQIDIKVVNVAAGSCDILVSSIDGILNYEIPISYLII